MGSDHHYPEEAPAHPVDVEGFWIDRNPVTNAQFLKFVKATGYRTLAERPADPGLYPDASPEQRQPASIVFVPPTGPVAQADHYRWWPPLSAKFSAWFDPSTRGPNRRPCNRPMTPLYGRQSACG